MTYLKINFVSARHTARCSVILSDRTSFSNLKNIKNTSAYAMSMTVPAPKNIAVALFYNAEGKILLQDRRSISK